MKVYLVFGDPRRPEKRLVFATSLSPDDVRLHGNTVWLASDGQTFEGGLLGSSPTPFVANGHGEPYISVLLSETPPSAAFQQSLLASGWLEASEYPAPDFLPFLVTTTLLVPDGEGYVAWTKPMWFPHAFVPTQRTALALDGSRDVPVRCLAMTLRRDSAHEALFLAESTSEEGLDFLRFDNWIRGTVPGGQWNDMAAVTDGVEATVTYVLGATIVDGAVLHDASRLATIDIEALLPSDVLDETVLALHAAGQRELLPPHLRLPEEEETAGDS